MFRSHSCSMSLLQCAENTSFCANCRSRLRKWCELCLP
jgi:hypothetical protein